MWYKNNKVGFANANKQPMRAHENILIFGQPGEKISAAYNPQKIVGCPVRKQRKVIKKSGIYGKQQEYITESNGTLHPSSVLEFDRDRRAVHPTQKPLALLEFLTKSYADENALVLDPFMGSGTAGVAAAKTNRRFVGIEKDKKYFDIAVERIKTAMEEL
ncbi:hypothetical protein FACS1894214_1020 [Planctomycetales bacterium]|nr:hypothetical protein FACS1894214_1020 [Planctomycetales bacterium]